ncbi:MAG: SEC-C motif-containing protein [Oleispira sp.]|jgi:SEC-C motif-containing protein
MNTKDLSIEPCPCGSNERYSDCCEPLHQGTPAASAEVLMRSRFSAFALQLSDYLKTSWHPDTRPEQLTLEQGTEWKRLEILSASNDKKQGTVHFKAYYLERNYLEQKELEQKQWHLLEETSKFLYENDHWFYHSGDYQPQQLKPSRNDECPCGSGKKYKKCCL